MNDINKNLKYISMASKNFTNFIENSFGHKVELSFTFFLSATGNRKSLKRDLDKLTICYFDTVGFLPIKITSPDYGSARATLSP
jgi:hypothetical protein